MKKFIILALFAVFGLISCNQSAMGWGIMPAIVSIGTPGYGDGSDGEFVSSGADQVVNSYTRITDATVNSGTAVINVNSAAALSVGNVVLILQTQHATNHGKYEFAKIQSINANQITLTSNLTNSYYSGTYDNVTAVAAEVIRVPQYTNVTVSAGHSITCTDWVETTNEGGVVAFYATGIVTVNGTIEVNEAAFRGGSGNWQGESYKGKGENSRSANDGAGGGGDGINESYGTGGGGGHLNAGSDGVTTGASIPGDGGGSYGEATLLSTIYFGSGGGGSDYDTGNPGNGGKGGGIVILKAENIRIGAAGIISSNGGPGTPDQFPPTIAGGGGSGGSVLLISNAYTKSGTVEATTTAGGTAASDGIVVEP